MAIYDYQGNEISAGESSYNWNGKKIVFEGDSITKNIGFPAYIANGLGASAVDISLAGFPVMGIYSGENKDMRHRISNIPSDADAIIVMGDINSHIAASNVTSDLYSFSTDLSKWAGRVNVYIDSVKRAFPTVPLFLVSEYGMETNGVTSELVADYYEIVAKRFGCVFVPVTSESGFSLMYSYPLYGKDGTDKVHAKTDCVGLWAECVLNKIKTIKPPTFANTDTISIDGTKSVTVGGTADIGYTVTGNLSLQWTSSDYTIACVMGGKVYGISQGTATITAKTRKGNTATCIVTVTA